MEDSPSYKRTRKQFDTYSRVKPQLEEMYGNTYYLANIQVFTKHNAHETVCSWSEFQPTVFPQTDTVALAFPVTDINSVYNISQKELIKLLGSFVKIKRSPITHYIVEELPDGELKKEIIKKAELIPSANGSLNKPTQSISTTTRLPIRLITLLLTICIMVFLFLIVKLILMTGISFIMQR